MFGLAGNGSQMAAAPFCRREGVGPNQLFGNQEPEASSNSDPFVMELSTKPITYPERAADTTRALA